MGMPLVGVFCGGKPMSNSLFLGLCILFFCLNEVTGTRVGYTTVTRSDRSSRARHVPNRDGYSSVRAANNRSITPNSSSTTRTPKNYEYENNNDYQSKRRGSRSRITNTGDVWSMYMEKFNIPRVHGSGVFVDLGTDVTVKAQKYRMPSGRCPVVGKSIILESGGFFLNRVDLQDNYERGLGFPRTIDKGTNKYDDSLSISPVTPEQLRMWNYNNPSDIANCAEYASNVVPASDPKTKYRYPFVYDAKERECHLLFSGMQYNQGFRYCDSDGNQQSGLSSLVCMVPIKTAADSDLFFGSANVSPKFEDICPMYPIKEAIYGKWNGTHCVAMDFVEEIIVGSADECGQYLFDNSPSDVRRAVKSDYVNEVDTFYNSLKTMKATDLFNTLFQPIDSERVATNSRGVGINWANYELETGRCRLIDTVPSCLIISAGNLALNSIGSTLEMEAEPYPCHIDTLGFPMVRRSSLKNGPTTYDNESVTTALTLETLQCSQYSHKRFSSSCGYYYECNSDPEYFSSHKWIAILISILLLIFFIGWLFWHLRRSKPKEPSAQPDYLSLLSKYEYEDMSKPVNCRDVQLESDDYVWGEAAARPSDVTPVHLSRLE